MTFFMRSLFGESICGRCKQTYRGPLRGISQNFEKTRADLIIILAQTIMLYDIKILWVQLWARYGHILMDFFASIRSCRDVIYANTGSCPQNNRIRNQRVLHLYDPHFVILAWRNDQLWRAQARGWRTHTLTHTHTGTHTDKSSQQQHRRKVKTCLGQSLE